MRGGASRAVEVTADFMWFGLDRGVGCRTSCDSAMGVKVVEFRGFAGRSSSVVRVTDLSRNSVTLTSTKGENLTRPVLAANPTEVVYCRSGVISRYGISEQPESRK